MVKYLNPINYYKKFISIINKIKFNRYLKSYDLRSIKINEENKFSLYGFNSDEAMIILNGAIQKAGFSENIQYEKGMTSIHWLLFACISKTHNNVNNILEIGTYNGITTRLLSYLFKNSNITTVDLPISDPILKTSYSRENEDLFNKYKKEQLYNVQSENINFIEANSFFLPEKLNESKFDLIWVDGGHHYPEIAWDICNAYHMCNDGGIIMVDDIIMDKKGYRDSQVSPDGYFVLEYMKMRMDINITYFLKRLDPKWSANPNKRKFVALFIKQ